MLPCLTHTEQIVKDMYQKMGILYPQQLDFQAISKQLNITIFYWQEPSQALIINEIGYIMLNKGISPQKQWQEFCHELCHVLHHVGNQCNLPESFITYQEMKANHFMLHASVPTFMLEELQLHDATPYNVALVQQLFNVEKEIAFKRLDNYLLRKLDMLNRNTYMYLK